MRFSLSSAVSGVRLGAARLWREAQVWAVTTFGPTLLRWWGNPLLHQARLEKPLPFALLARVIPIAGGVVALAGIAAWATGERTLGAVMIALPPGAALAPLLAAPAAGVITALAPLRASAKTPRGMTTADPAELVWGMALVALWRLRWLIVAGLIATPALMIAVLHLDVSAFTTYRENVLALGSAAPLEQSRLLLPDAGIPLFRLVMRALSAGLLPWTALPLLASLGVSAGLLLRDVALSLLASLIAAVVALMIVAGVWQVVTFTYLLGQWLEVVRLALIGGLLAGVGGLAWLVNRQNAALLVKLPPDEGII